MPVLTQRQVDVVEALYGLNINLARGFDDDRRKLTRIIAEQFRFEFGPKWGTKSTTPGHPQSKDAIAYDNGDGTIDVWDWQNGTTREPQVGVGDEPDFTNLNQHFIAVEPINHLGGEVPDNNDDDNNDEEAALAAILKKIAENTEQIRADQVRLLEGQSAIMQAIQVLIDKPTPEIPPIQFPEYKASTWFGTITLKPQQ